MQCLPNLVFKQLCECVQGAGFPYCSNYGVELVFALLCFSTPQSPHWFWMGIKHQVAGSEMTKHHTDGRPLHQVCMAQTDYTIESNCHCIIFSRGMKGSSYTQQKKTTIQTNDTHTHFRLCSHSDPSCPSPAAPNEVKEHLWQSILGEISVPKLSVVMSRLVWCHTPRKPSDLPSLHMLKKDIMKKNSHHLFLIKYEAVSMFGSHNSSHFYCCLFTVGYGYSFLFI